MTGDKVPVTGTKHLVSLILVSERYIHLYIEIIMYLNRIVGTVAMFKSLVGIMAHHLLVSQVLPP